jgi:predicted nucleic acid-binding Zn ribbon protein
VSSADGPRPVGDALRAVRRQLGTPEPSVLERVQAAWADVVGDVLAAHSRPLHLRAGVLRVHADDPAWAGQFRYLGDTVVAALATGVPEAAIRQISVTAPRPTDAAAGGATDDGSGWSDEGGEPA